MDIYLVTAKGPFMYDTVGDGIVYAHSAAEAKALFAKVVNVQPGPYTARKIKLDGTSARVLHVQFNAG